MSVPEPLTSLFISDPGVLDSQLTYKYNARICEGFDAPTCGLRLSIPTDHQVCMYFSKTTSYAAAISL